MSACRAHCPRCGLCFSGDRAFDMHVTLEGHRDPREILTRAGAQRLVGRPGTCRFSLRPEARAGAEAFSRARSEARARSRTGGRRGLLSAAALDGIHEAANRAEAGAGGRARRARPQPVVVWGEPGGREWPAVQREDSQDATVGAGAGDPA